MLSSMLRVFGLILLMPFVPLIAYLERREIERCDRENEEWIKTLPPDDPDRVHHEQMRAGAKPRRRKAGTDRSGRRSGRRRRRADGGDAAAQ